MSWARYRFRETQLWPYLTGNIKLLLDDAQVADILISLCFKINLLIDLSHNEANRWRLRYLLPVIWATPFYPILICALRWETVERREGNNRLRRTLSRRQNHVAQFRKIIYYRKAPGGMATKYRASRVANAHHERHVPLERVSARGRERKIKRWDRISIPENVFLSLHRSQHRRSGGTMK